MKFGINNGSSLGLRISIQKLIGVGQIWDSRSFQLSGRGCLEQYVKKDSEVQWGESTVIYW